MKQFVVIAGIVLLAACGSNSGTTKPTDSASAAPHDTTNAVNPPVPDTSIIRKDSNHIMGDKTDPRKDSLLR